MRVNNLPDNDPSLRDLLRIIDRRRVIFIATALAVFGISVLVCIFMTRKYEAVGEFQVESSSADGLDMSDLMGSSSSSSMSPTSVDTDLETAADILESDNLALRVIKKLNLKDNPDFQPSWDPIGWVLSMITPAGPADNKDAPLEDRPHLRTGLVKEFGKDLKVDVESGTRLIQVTYYNGNRKVAAQVVNELIQSLIDYNFQTKFKATDDISKWLEGQLSDLRKQTEDLQAKVVAVQQQSGIFGAGGVDLNGKPVIYSPDLDKLQASTTELAEAELNKVLKGAIYEVAKSGNPDLISQLAGTSLPSGTTAGVTNTLELIQSLRTQEATLQAQVDQDAAHYGSSYPKLIEERQALKGLDQSLKDEIERLRGRAENDFRIAEVTAVGAQRSFDDARTAAEKLNNKTIEYTLLSQEANDAETLYQDLLKKLKEASIMEGLQYSNITMVDVALTPDKPARPNVPLYLALGVALGGFLGVCAALLWNSVDNKVQGVEEIEALGIPVVSILPQFKSGEPSRLLPGPDSQATIFTEAVRTLRSSLIISRSAEPPKVLLVTSGSPGEGKTTIAGHLAASFAQYNKRVLLLEADMRRPTAGRRLGVNVTGGLSVLLANQDAPIEPVPLPNLANLEFIPAGPTPPYPSELLGSSRMQSLIDRWRQEYDFVVIDSPPVLPVTDSQILASYADAIVLVVRARATSRLSVRRSYNMLVPHTQDPNNPNVGVVLNSISVRSAGYYGYYGYYGGQKYEYGSQEVSKHE
jgi:capsular exopolysaccharide synthesis family protein